MDANSKDGALAIVGLLMICYAGGMAVTSWFYPASPAAWLFRARWRSGVKASVLGTAAQVALCVSLGATLLLGAFHLPSTKFAASALGVSVIIGFYAWIRDMVGAGEP